MKHIKLFEQFLNENKEISLEDMLSKYMITFEDYCSRKNNDTEIKKRALSLLDEMMELSKSNKEISNMMFQWFTGEGSTLKLQAILRKTSYQGGNREIANSPEQLLDFNAFALLDTVSMHNKQAGKIPTSFSFFEVRFGLSHAVENGILDNKELDRIEDAITDNRVKTDKLKEILGDRADELIDFIIDKNKY